MIEYPPSTEIPKEVYAFVMDRDCWCCQNPRCVNKFGRYNSLTLHHIVPRSAGGLGTDPCNLIVLCWPCHDQISYLKNHVKELEDLKVTDMTKLAHREQGQFFDHDYPPHYLWCSHRKSYLKEDEKHRKGQSPMEPNDQDKHEHNTDEEVHTSKLQKLLQGASMEDRNRQRPLPKAQIGS